MQEAKGRRMSQHSFANSVVKPHVRCFRQVHHLPRYMHECHLLGDDVPGQITRSIVLR